MTVRPPARTFVAKDGTVWRWTCRVPLCGATDWRGRVDEANRDATEHLGKHAQFGIRR